MPAIHFRTTVDAEPERVYDALATQEGLAGNWTPVGGFPGWIGTSITWRLEPADDGRTVVNFEHGGWPEQAADGEMAMCGYTWAMIIDRLTNQVARGERAPYFTADAPLPN
jgi:uncharacterized protein YndB with AHSA1/START domain